MFRDQTYCRTAGSENFWSSFN